MCDTTGCIHDISIESMQIKSTNVASKPIFSGPIIVGDSVVFGCHDGIVRCVSSSDFADQLWQYDAQSVVYSSTLPLSGGRCIVCTTAGDVILIQAGKELWRTKVVGEIWSDAVQVGMGGAIIFGARDSRIHTIKLK